MQWRANKKLQQEFSVAKIIEVKMSSGRVPLAPRNVEYQTRKPRSAIPQYDKAQLVVSLRWFNNCADGSAVVEPKITEDDIARPTVSCFL